MDDLLERLQQTIPVKLISYNLLGKRAGLVVVDEINGFCTPGAGALAPPEPDADIRRMISETDRLARWFQKNTLPIFVFKDTHEPDRPEPPYPPHCVRGTGEENLVPELAWLERANRAKKMPKDCINGFVGSIAFNHDLNEGHTEMGSMFIDGVNLNNLETLVIVGICTDICDMDLVLTLLSARNHGLLPSLKDIVVYEPGCATYDLPKEVAVQIGLPPEAAHPRSLTHYMGLYFMASRGAILASDLQLD